MDKKVTGILSYLGLLWFVAYFAGDKENAKFHLNQGLVLMICAIGGSIVVGVISFIGGILASIISIVGAIVSGIAGLFGLVVWLGTVVLMVMGIISAVNGEEKALPVIGKYQVLK